MNEDEAKQVSKRMQELMEPVDIQIMTCETNHDLIMLACAMMQRSREILDSQIGEEGRKTIFNDVNMAASIVGYGDEHE
mgnify:CR=1 FL=1